MNLHGLVSSAIGTVNPLVTIVLERSSGSTTGASGKRTPAYDAPVSLLAQVQPTTAGDLRQAEGINLQGVMRNIYISGAANGLIRIDMKGGDKITHEGKPWLVTHVLEMWPNWCSAMMTLQND